VEVHLVDGTYELFRHHFAVPSHQTADGVEVAATRAVVGSILGMLEGGATHVGVATDQVVESFRNDMFEGYKTGEGTPPELFAQFPLLKAALEAAGFRVFAMVEHEADDAMGAAAVKAAEDPRVDRILICTPDKDLAQVVDDGLRIVQHDRRKDIVYDRDGIIERFGVRPESIPDYLALVGDTADGIPGLPGWGAKSSSTVLARYLHLEEIPDDANDWDVAGVTGEALVWNTNGDTANDVISSTNRLTSNRRCVLTPVVIPQSVSKIRHISSRLVFPARPPIPLMAQSTAEAPASTAATALAVARP